MRNILAVVLSFSAFSAQATTFNIDFLPTVFSEGGNEIIADVGGITVTGRGFIVEVDDDAGETLFGPVPVVSSISNSGLSLTTAGLGLTALPTTDQPLGGSDRGSGNIAPGFNGYYITTSVRKTEFLVLSFSQAVNVGSVIVDDVSNFGRSVWMAYGDAALDFSGGLVAGLASLSVLNSADDATDGLFTHALGASGISTLVIGAPFSSGNYGPIAGADSLQQFYIRGLGEVSLAATDGGSGNNGGGTDPGTPGLAVIPLPASGLLLAFALALVAGVRARRPAAA
jgi:hypothetical protein